MPDTPKKESGKNNPDYTGKKSLEDLRTEYLTQDSRFTAYPIYVTVQELHFIGVIDDDYSYICPYGDGVVRKEWVDCEDRELVFTSLDELKEFIEENDGYTLSDFEEIRAGYIWADIEWFLTVKGAEEFIKANRHNLKKEVRTYVHQFNRHNFEMRDFLSKLSFYSEGDCSKSDSAGDTDR